MPPFYRRITRLAAFNSYLKVWNIYRIMTPVIKMSKKTNAIRIVEQAGYPCEEAYYEYDPDNLDGNLAASAIGMPAEQVFKTLVARGANTGIHVFCIPVCCELDLKLAAKAAGDKSIQLLHVNELLTTTGYIRGGCSPLGMKKKFPTHIDETCMLWEKIAVSAGERGHQMILSPQAIISLTNATINDIIC